MPRKPRFNLPGVPQHVVQRGNNREPCFYAVDDYFRYLDDLFDASEKNRVAIHAYVLMTNHVHLLVTPAEDTSGSDHVYLIYYQRFLRQGVLTPCHVVPDNQSPVFPSTFPNLAMLVKYTQLTYINSDASGLL